MFRDRFRKVSRVGGFVRDVVSPARRRFRKAWPVINAIDGHLVPGQEWWLYETASRLQDSAVLVEIGSFKGRSTACLALGCQGTRKRVYTIDTFNGNDVDFHERDFFETFRANLDRAGLCDWVESLIGDSKDVGKRWSRPIDFIFIDGSHQYVDVLSDFETFYPHVKQGGLIAFHDVVDGWPGPLEVWERVARHRLVRIGRCTTIAYGYKCAPPGA